MSKLERYRLVPDTSVSRVGRALATIRSYWSGPLTSRSPELAGLWGAAPVSAGVAVSEATALNYSAVWCGVGLISGQLGNLPCVLYKKSVDSKERFESHRVYRLVHDRPNPEMSAFVFRETLQAHVLLWGNGYSEIERDNANSPVALWPLTPDRVRPYRDGPNAPLRYLVRQADGREQSFGTNDILHIPGLGWDGTCGYSVVGKARESIGPSTGRPNPSSYDGNTSIIASA